LYSVFEQRFLIVGLQGSVMNSCLYVLGAKLWHYSKTEIPGPVFDWIIAIIPSSFQVLCESLFHFQPYW